MIGVLVKKDTLSYVPSSLAHSIPHMKTTFNIFLSLKRNIDKSTFVLQSGKLHSNVIISVAMGPSLILLVLLLPSIVS